METGMPVREIMTSDPITIDKGIKIKLIYLDESFKVKYS